MSTLNESEEELKRRAREFAETRIAPNASAHVEAGRYPFELFEAAVQEGLVGRSFDGSLGGEAGSLVDTCLVTLEFCRGDSSIGCALDSATAGCHIPANFGTEAQRERFVSPVLEGECISAIGMTEPETGSSLQGIETAATRDGDEYVISGRKRWISNGKDARWVATLCRTDPEAHLSDALSVIVVPTDADGFHAEPIETMGLHAMEQAEIAYDDVRVPASNLIEQEGAGFRQVMSWLNGGHGRIAMGAVNIGMALGAFDRARAYARDRSQRGSQISDYQGLRWTFADMKTNLEVAQAQILRAARAVDRDAPPGEVIEQANIAKLFATEAACDVVDDALQIFGGNGYAKEYEVERIYRDVRAGTLYEGTSEILRNTIAQVLFDEL